MRRQWVSACTLLLLLLSSPAAAQETNLLALVNDLGAVLEWDPLLDTGLIAVGDDRICLGVGLDYALINYRMKVRIDPPARRQGVVWLSRAAVNGIGEAIQKDRLRDAGAHMRVAYVIIDPGHGGKDSGAVGKYTEGTKKVNLEEKDVTLKIALLLGDMLKQGFPDRQIVFTRVTDVYSSLEDRVAAGESLLAKTKDTVLFLAIHANSSLKRPSPTGFEAWVLPPEYPRTVVDIATVGEENKDIFSILNSMKQEEISLESTTLAQQILAGLEAKIGPKSANRGLRSNDWYVVRNSRMPAVLTEVGFVSNPEEAARLADDAYLKDVAMGMYNGIEAFITRFERRGDQ
jgi:N-acetylmuramoyl-L-alanine amidase